MTVAVNIFPTISSQDYADLNWHISFMTIIEKPSLPQNLAMILLKTVFLSHLLKSLKNL